MNRSGVIAYARGEEHEVVSMLRFPTSHNYTKSETDYPKLISICHVISARDPAVWLGISCAETATAWTTSQIMNEVREQGMHAGGKFETTR